MYILIWPYSSSLISNWTLLMPGQADHANKIIQLKTEVLQLSNAITEIRNKFFLVQNKLLSARTIINHTAERYNRPPPQAGQPRGNRYRLVKSKAWRLLIFLILSCFLLVSIVQSTRTGFLGFLQYLQNTSLKRYQQYINISSTKGYWWSKLDAGLEVERRWLNMLQQQESLQIKEAVNYYIKRQKKRREKLNQTMNGNIKSMSWELQLRLAIKDRKERLQYISITCVNIKSNRIIYYFILITWLYITIYQYLLLLYLLLIYSRWFTIHIQPLAISLIHYT